MTTEINTEETGGENAPIENTSAPTESAPIEPAGAAPAKKRGRPSNAERAARAAGASTAEKIESGNAPQSAASGKAKSGKSAKRVTATDAGALAKQLVGLHTLGAMISGIPEFIINEDEGKILAGGIVAVCEEYDLSIDGKTGAALNLLGACAMVYGPRVFKVAARAQAAKKARQAGAADSPQPPTFEAEVSPTGAYVPPTN